MKAVQAIVNGVVQGVGFRYFVEREARARGLDGWVRNRREGTVEAVISGEDAAVDAMVEHLHRGPPGAAVTAVHAEPYSGDVDPGTTEIRVYTEQDMPAYAYGPRLLSISHGRRSSCTPTASSLGPHAVP